MSNLRSRFFETTVDKSIFFDTLGVTLTRGQITMTETTSPEKKRPKKINQLELLPVEIHLSRRNLPKYTKNPFVDLELLNQLAGKKNVFYTQTRQTGIVDMRTGEIEEAKTLIVKTIRSDKECFVKIFTTHLKAFFELNQTAYKILQYVLHTVQSDAINTDEVYLNYERALKYFESIDQKCSRANYFKGMKDLVSRLFIAETTSTNQYYINPKIFFNGDRTQFVTNFELIEAEENKKLNPPPKELE